jgi:choline-glycine betaine transporter
MKVLKPRFDLLLYIFIPVCVLANLLYFLCFYQILNLANSNWLFSALLILFIILPKGRITFGKTPTPIKLSWFLGLFSCMLVVNLLTWSFTKIISITPLSNLQVPVDLIRLSFATGLFPWGFTILFAVTLGFFTYHEDRIGLVSSLYTPLFHNTHLDSVGIAVDSYMRSISIGIVVLILAMLAYSSLMLLNKFWHFPWNTGLRVSVYLTSIGLVLIFSHQLFTKFLYKLRDYKVPIWIIFLVLVALIVVIYPLLSYLSVFISSFTPPANTSFPVTNPLFKANNIYIVVIFWWYSLSILAAAVMMYLSRNRTIRQFVLTTLVSFLITLAIIALLDKLNNYVGETYLPLGLMVVLSIVVIFIMLNNRYSTYFLRATLPSNHPIKKRATFNLLRILPIVIISAFIAYLAMGASLWSYFVVLVFLPPWMIISISYISLLKSSLSIDT